MKTGKKDWGIFLDKEIGNVIHIYPLDEVHSEGIMSGSLPPPISDCPCKPKVKWNEEKETWIIIHGAFDGREAIEEVIEILK